MSASMSFRFGRGILRFRLNHLSNQTKLVRCDSPDLKLSCSRMLQKRSFHFVSTTISENSRRCFPSVSPNCHTSNPLRFRCYSSNSERVCWKCGRNTNPPAELFFCDCGMVQSPAEDLDYFSLFGLNFDFDVDTNSLSKMYKELQKLLHPDKFTQKSEKEQQLAEQQSSLVNKAYFILLKPLPRGLYMLDHYGYPIEESSGDVDPNFLMEIMETNERLDEAESKEEVKEIEEEMHSLVKDTISKISVAFKSKKLDEAKKLMVKYQYYGNIEDKIKDWYRREMH